MMRKKRFYQRGVLFAAVVAAASVSGCGNAAKDAPSSVNGAESEPDGSRILRRTVSHRLEKSREKVAKARMESRFMQECL